MKHISFNETITIGAISFQIIGKYYKHYSSSDNLDIEYEEIIARINTEDDILVCDGKILLNSLNCWELLISELTPILMDYEIDENDNEFDSLDDEIHGDSIGEDIF